MSQWLIFLVVIPLLVNYFTKESHSKYRFMWLGIAVGAVIAPVSFGLIQMAYIPFIGKILGLIGVIGNLTHGPVGYLCLVGSGVIESSAVLSAVHLTMINVVNGVLFGYIYGLIGYAVDKKATSTVGVQVKVPA